MPIYSKKGDKGETGIFGGKRVSKSDPLIEAIGVIDELNATLGLAIGQIQDSGSKIQDRNKRSREQEELVTGQLEEIQKDLFAIGARLAGYNSKVSGFRGQVLEKRTIEMEKEIDEMWGKMPPLKNFILPQGQIHLARTVCRRAERAAVRVLESRKVGSESVVKYLNRLSDYLFCLARFVNFKKGAIDKVWRT